MASPKKEDRLTLTQIREMKKLRELDPITWSLNKLGALYHIDHTTVMHHLGLLHRNIKSKVLADGTTGAWKKRKQIVYTHIPIEKSYQKLLRKQAYRRSIRGPRGEFLGWEEVKPPSREEMRERLRKEKEKYEAVEYIQSDKKVV